ncbi:hypothetical protein EON65_28100 [archaeon]|nr:MAG: hypothetical protein EON65_28100 [archaeon]
MRNRGCFAYDFDGSTYSVLTDYPNEYFFPNGHCGGEPIDEALMDDLEATCVNAPTSDDDDSVDDVTWTGFTSEISCSMPSSSECGYPGEETDNTPLKTGQVVGLVIGTIGGAAIVLTSAYFIFLYATASKGAEAGAGATAAGAV